jgi:hypothetical protein
MAKAKTPPPKPVPLTVAQLSAVDLLAGGKNDSETADALGVHRVTVTRWRNYSPEFRAALAERRQAVWGSAADKLRALVPKALDTLAAELEHGADKAHVALAVLKLTGAAIAVVPTDPTDPDEYVREAVKAERKARSRDRDGELDDIIAGQFGGDTPLDTVRKRLAELANEPADAERTMG